MVLPDSCRDEARRYSAGRQGQQQQRPGFVAATSGIGTLYHTGCAVSRLKLAHHTVDGMADGMLNLCPNIRAMKQAVTL